MGLVFELAAAAVVVDWEQERVVSARAVDLLGFDEAGGVSLVTSVSPMELISTNHPSTWSIFLNFMLRMSLTWMDRSGQRVEVMFHWTHFLEDLLSCFPSV